ncbi:phosphoglycerate dehydrogenase [Aldersonia sp. NBC_00410]|uniref:phosphoglycerate dehydrogenase n=1 Tax=Aldersonia sp. NBC_00410 TaxID=2975954 RepID=UPI002251D841|nr:phosphoglycerate dehydrogenase [Aldersonia sp. NBC_00410]MCX5046408.1 phosphoglycerate dehydrogenase [Aldersonia sp. NBC_00410]
MATVVVTTDYLTPGDQVHGALTRAGHEVRYAPAGGARDSKEAKALFDDCAAAIVASEPITADMLSGAGHLRVVARSGVGYDSIDTATATELGIWVCNTPGVNHHAVAEMTFALMLDVARQLSAVTSGVQAGRWPRQAGTELRGAVLGVIGYGPSGRAVADLGRAFGMTVLVTTAHNQPDREGVEFVDLDTLCVRADYISLHTKANADNESLIDRRRLAMMKPTAALINTARGSLIDESALIDALDAGQLAAAALDVVAVEPLPPTSALLGRDDIIITSHLAGQTQQARTRAGLAAADNVIAVLDGRRPPSPVNEPAVTAAHS